MAHNDGIVVSNIAYTGEVTFMQDFVRVWPGVVVLFQGGPLSVSRVFELVEDVPELNNLRVITVLSNNNVNVYEKLKVSAAHSDDFITLIRHNTLVT